MPKYLSIEGDFDKNKKIYIRIKIEHLPELSQLPDYLYNDVVKDLLKTNLEIYGFTKRKLGINSESLFKEFEQFKSNQQYDLKSKVDFEEWIDKKAQILINDISSKIDDQSKEF